MVLRWQNSLASRFLIAVAVATVLPLVLLVVAVLWQGYQASAAQTYAAVEERASRYAAQFEARLEEKLGFLRGLAESSGGHLSPGPQRRGPVWVRLVDQSVPGETAAQLDLYNAVAATRNPTLSEPDFTTNQASVGLPLFDDGRFIGMMAESFSLSEFQTVVEGVHLFQTGYAILVSHHGYRIAHPAKKYIGVRLGNDVGAAMAADLLAKTEAGKAFWFEKPSLVSGKWSRQFFTPVSVGTGAPWFFAIIVPVDEVTGPLDALFFILIVGAFLTLLLVGGATWMAIHRLVAMIHERTSRLETSLSQLEQAQAKLVEAERLAVLGQLMATIAHEVNTPLGAIQSSASYLRSTVIERVDTLPDLFRGLSEDDVALYRRLVLRRIAAPQTLVNDRKRRRRLVSRLEALGVDQPDDLADDIVFLSAENEQDELAVAPSQYPVIRMAAQTAHMVESGIIILEAADRAASTVTALGNYSRLHALDSQEDIDPAQELDTILTIYYGMSKKGVVVTKDFEPGVRLRGDRDKLNQVWVNLINNALQAMNYRGRLRLSVRRTADGCEIAVANDGPRVPDDIRGRIFEPFFTTKPAGEGTGLGLDVCRRIVTAHGGKLSLSDEGEFTVFTTFLPRRTA